MKHLIILALVLTGNTCMVNAQTGQHQENLVSDTGFEGTSKRWFVDNWAKNEIDCALDTGNPHSGRSSMRVSLVKTTGQVASLMLSYPNLGVQPNTAVRIRFWARGVSNGAALTMMLRKNKAPYKVYFRAETPLLDEWKEFTFTTMLQSDVDTADVSLRFALSTPGVFWIDDISVQQLPAQEGGLPPSTNPVRNASFEAGTDGWTASFRALEFKTLWDESGGNYPCPPGAKLETVKDSTSPNGQRYMSFDVPERSRVMFTSAYFHARYGHKCHLTFSMRSDKAHPFTAGVGAGKNGSYIYQQKSGNTATQWQTITMSLILKPAPGGVYNIQLLFNEPGHYDLDAFSLIEDEVKDPVSYPASFAIRAASRAPVANMYSPGQKATFSLITAGQQAGSVSAFQVVVFDYAEKKWLDIKLSVTADKSGYGEITFTAPTTRMGAFRIEARDLREQLLLAEQLYTVLPSLPPPGERPGSYFGGHMDLTPYNLEIARKAGFRWLRLYPPLTTRWMVVEPSPGEWKFDTTAIISAHKQGFQLLGGFDTAPDYAADIDPNSSVKHRWSRSYPPKDLHQWKEYVARCFNKFSPYISAWEVWNEPDGYYLQARPELRKEEIYSNILNATREVLDSIGKPVVLMGPAVASINAPLVWQILEMGEGKNIDACSFHFYSLSAGGDNPDDGFVLPLLKKYRTYKNRSGNAMPLWHTEGGIYLNGSQSWLATYQIPSSSAVTPPQAAASMVRAALLFKSMDVKRYFDYQAGTSAAGSKTQEDITSGFIDVTGIPGPGIAAHAVMVSLTEDALPAGFETVKGYDGRIKVARFRGSNVNVDVFWGGISVPLSKVAGLQQGDEIKDMMGNAVLPGEASTGEFPLYVLRKNKSS